MNKSLSTHFCSRQYMSYDDFEIHYYNDRDLTLVGNHTHPYYEFYFFLSGEVSLRINDVDYALKPNDVVLIPPGIPHRADILTSSVPYKRFVFWITRDYCDELEQISKDYIQMMKQAAATSRFVFHFDDIEFNSLQSRLLQLIEELHSNRYGRETKITLCVNELIFQLNRSLYELDNPDVPHEELSLYQKLATYIENHLDERLSLDSLAGEFYVSKYHIAHIFKESLGLSVHQYILKKRLSKCRDAILGNVEISEAFLSFGFKEYTSFYRAFKKEYGMSPKEYRQTHCRETDKKTKNIDML